MTLDPDQSHKLSVFYVEGTTTTRWLQEKFIPVRSCWKVNQREDMNPSAIREMKGSMIHGTFWRQLAEFIHNCI